MTIARFVVFEVLAITVLVAALFGGVAIRFGTGSFTPLFHILPIASAIAVTVLPILFFGQPRCPVRTPNADLRNNIREVSRF